LVPYWRDAGGNSYVEAIMLRFVPAFALVFALLLLSCSNSEPEISSLRGQIQELNKSVEDLKMSVKDLQTDQSFDQVIRDAESNAFFNSRRRRIFCY
jgi:cell division protein FtsL